MDGVNPALQRRENASLMWLFPAAKATKNSRQNCLSPSAGRDYFMPC
jgi:hypothetical protein